MMHTSKANICAGCDRPAGDAFACTHCKDAAKADLTAEGTV